MNLKLIYLNFLFIVRNTLFDRLVLFNGDFCFKNTTSKYNRRGTRIKWENLNSYSGKIILKKVFCNLIIFGNSYKLSPKEELKQFDNVNPPFPHKTQELITLI